MSDLLDPELLSALDALAGHAFRRSVWRVTWASRNPLAGSSSGGRWSPDGSIEALYTSLDADGALAEAYYHLSRAPVMSSSHMLLNQLEVALDSVLELTAAQLRDLGVDDLLVPTIQNERTRAIGEAAFMLDYQGLIVPSVRWPCNNLVLFIGRIDSTSNIRLAQQTDVNWPAWRERSAP